jgi:hypothetical protein
LIENLRHISLSDTRRLSQFDYYLWIFRLSHIQAPVCLFSSHDEKNGAKDNPTEHGESRTLSRRTLSRSVTCNLMRLLRKSVREESDPRRVCADGGTIASLRSGCRTVRCG